MKKGTARKEVFSGSLSDLHKLTLDRVNALERENAELRKTIEQLKAEIADRDEQLAKLREVLTVQNAKIDSVRAQRDKYKAEYQAYVERQAGPPR